MSERLKEAVLKTVVSAMVERDRIHAMSSSHGRPKVLSSLNKYTCHKNVFNAERCLSGWRRQSWKLLYQQWYREFESRPLRIKNNIFNMHYVYVLKLNNGSIYTGYSSDLKRRYHEHTLGKVLTTSKYLPVKLIYYEAYCSKTNAIKREKFLKTTKGKSSLKTQLTEP